MVGNLHYSQYHSGVTKQGLYRFTHLTIISVRITITYRNHYTTKYTPYQQYLYDRIKGYKDNIVSGIGYRKITKILNSEGLKTPMGKVFKPNNVFSIYKKGKIREERLNSEVIVEKEMEVEQFHNQNILLV